MRLTLAAFVLLSTPALAQVCAFKRGDANQNGTVDGIADPAYISNWFSSGGPDPISYDAADANDDGVVNLADASWITNWYWQNGPQPPAPGPFVDGLDPTADDLDTTTSPKSDPDDAIPGGLDEDHQSIAAPFQGCGPVWDGRLATSQKFTSWMEGGCFDGPSCEEWKFVATTGTCTREVDAWVF